MVPYGQSWGYFAAVDFKGWISINDLPHPNSTAYGERGGVRASYAAQQNVGVTEIDVGIHGQRHHLHSTARSGAADHRVEAGAIGQERVVHAGNRDRFI